MYLILRLYQLLRSFFVILNPESETIRDLVADARRVQMLCLCSFSNYLMLLYPCSDDPLFIHVILNSEITEFVNCI